MVPTINETTTQTPTATTNDTTTAQVKNFPSHNWEFLVAVLATAISVSLIMALLAKCQVIRRYLASYRHTRLAENDAVSQCESSGLEVEFSMRPPDPRCLPPVSEEDDDGFIEDNYISASDRARAERAVQDLEEDTEEELSEIEFSIT